MAASIPARGHTRHRGSEKARSNELLDAGSELTLIEPRLDLCHELVYSRSEPASTNVKLFVPDVCIDSRALWIVLCVGQDESPQLVYERIDVVAIAAAEYHWRLTIELSGAGTAPTVTRIHAAPAPMKC